MKTLLITTAAAGMFLAMPVLAQDTTTTPPATPPAVTEPAVPAPPAATMPGTAMPDAAAGFGTLTIDELRGLDVIGPDGSSVGKVTDAVIGADAIVSRIIVDVGGFLGIGAKSVALDPAQVRIERATDSDTVTLHVGLTKDELHALPEYTG